MPAGGGPFYCLRSPQYFCGPLFQQPDFMHADWRSPQLVRQVDIDDRLRLFLHAAIQIFSSPLQRIGADKAGAVESRAQAAKITASAAISRSRRVSSESIRCVMPMSYGHHPPTATPGLRCLPQRLAIDTYSSIVMAGSFRPSMSLN